MKTAGFIGAISLVLFLASAGSVAATPGSDNFQADAVASVAGETLAMVHIDQIFPTYAGEDTRTWVIFEWEVADTNPAGAETRMRIQANPKMGGFAISEIPCQARVACTSDHTKLMPPGRWRVSIPLSSQSPGTVEVHAMLQLFPEGGNGESNAIGARKVLEFLPIPKPIPSIYLPSVVRQ